MCFPVRKKSGRSSLALAVWNSSLSLNLHSSSSSSLPTVCLKELRSALMTHRVAPTGRQTGRRGTETLTMTWNSTLLQDAFHTVSHSQSYTNVVLVMFLPVRHSGTQKYISTYAPPITHIPVYDFIVCIWSAFVPLRKENFLRKPGVTKESAKQRRRPLNSRPVVLMLTE